MFWPTSRVHQAIEEHISHLFAGKATLAEFSYRILPSPRFKLTNLVVEENGTTLFTAKKITGTLSLMDLFKKELTLSPVVEGLVVPDLSHFKKFQSKTAKEEWTYRLAAFTITSGDISILRGGDKIPLHFQEISLSIPQFGTTTFPLHLQAKFAETTRPNFSLEGNMTFQQGGREIKFEPLKGLLGKLPFALSGSFCLTCDQPEYAFHVTTNQFHPERISDQETPLKVFAQNLSWQSPVVLDLSLKRKAANIEFSGSVDAEASAFSYGKLFTKAAQYPFKGKFLFHLNKEKISVSEALFELGQSQISMTGFWKRGENRIYNFLVKSETIDLKNVKPYFPFLSIIEELEAPSFSLTFQEGEETDETTSWLSGTVNASQATLFGKKFETLELHLFWENDALTFPVVKGSFAGGVFSGTGKMLLEESPRYEFSTVMQDVDMETFSLPFPLRGKGALVTTLATYGSTPLELKDHETIGGTLLMNEAMLFSPFGSSLFPPEMFQEILGSPVPSQKNMERLTANDLKITDLHADFQSTSTELEVKPVTFNSSLFLGSAEIHARTDTLEGSGKLALTPAFSATLVPSPLLRQKASDIQGRLVIPFTLKHDEHQKIYAALDQETLSQQMQGKKEAVIVIAPATLKTELPSSPTGKTQPQMAKKIVPKETLSETKPLEEKSGVIEDDEMDDLLKVIIGK